MYMYFVIISFRFSKTVKMKIFISLGAFVINIKKNCRQNQKILSVIISPSDFMLTIGPSFDNNHG